MKKIIPKPPGRSAGNSYMIAGAVAIILMFVRSVSFPMRLNTAIDRLYRAYSVTYSDSIRFYPEKKILIDGAMMPKPEELLENCFTGFWVLIIAAIASIAFNYLYFAGESKSIYLMKRLPKRHEIHKMCLSGPIIMLLAGIAIMMLIAYAYYRMYFLKSPAQCIPETEIDSIIGLLWGAII